MIGQLPPRLLTDGETLVKQFHPHWRTYLPAGSLALLVLAVSVLLPTGSARPYVLLAGVAVSLAIGVYATIRRVSVIYALTSHRLVWRQGILRRTGVEIPLEQINTVSFSQRLLERALGYGDLVIESAGANGESRLTDIPDPQAFQSLIYSVRDPRKRSLYNVHDTTAEAGSQTAVAEPAPPSLTAVAGGRWEQVERLAQLNRDGLIDDDEFARAKRELLS